MILNFTHLFKLNSATPDTEEEFWQVLRHSLSTSGIHQNLWLFLAFLTWYLFSFRSHTKVHPCISICDSVRPSVGPSIRPPVCHGSEKQGKWASSASSAPEEARSRPIATLQLHSLRNGNWMMFRCHLRKEIRNMQNSQGFLTNEMEELCKSVCKDMNDMAWILLALPGQPPRLIEIMTMIRRNVALQRVSLCFRWKITSECL